MFALVGSATAQPAPDYDFQWQTVGSPGNRAANAQEAPFLIPPHGSVDSSFRITRTELTVSQYFQFLTAYRPYITGSPADISITGFWIRWNGSSYSMIPGSEHYAADMSWRMAARYCNWLENGKATARAAFESGAYDTSTFTQNSDGTLNDQISHTPGANFWIPTLDQWIKAVYYDPNRYGPGQDGYWRYPGSSDSVLTPGLPQDGGQTSAGIQGLLGIDAGSYPEVQTPWGLLDASGGVTEWTETLHDVGPRSRWSGGSYTGDLSLLIDDRIDFPNIGGAYTGLRVASVVPAPLTALPVVSGLLFLTRRRRLE